MLNDGTLDSITKKERLTLARDKEKMEKVLGGIAQISRVPAALFLVDIGHEHIALAEARRLGITTFGMVDTNCDPNKVEFSIPANGCHKINCNSYQLYSCRNCRRSCRKTGAKG